MIGINDYLNRIANKGFASSARYQITFQLPRGVPANFSNGISVNPLSTTVGIPTVQNNLNANGEIDLRCTTAQFPGRSIMTTENRQYGSPFMFPYSFVYEPISFSFYSSEELHEKRYFEVWQETVANVVSNTMNFYDEYKSDVVIQKIKRDGKESEYSAKIFDAYPVNVAAIEVSYSSQNEIMLTTVTLAFRYWSAFGDWQRSTQENGVL